MEDLGLAWFDLAAIAVIVLSTLFALIRGAVREILAIAAWVGAFVVAWYGFQPTRPHVHDLVGHELAADAITAAVVFLGPLLLFKLVSFKIGALIAAIGLRSVDRLLGAAFGLARGALIVCLAVIVVDFFTGHGDRPTWLAEARTLPYADDGIEVLRGIVPDEIEARARRTVEGAIESGDQMRNPERLLGPPTLQEQPQQSPGYDDEQRIELERLIEREAGTGPEARP